MHTLRDLKLQGWLIGRLPWIWQGWVWLTLLRQAAGRGVLQLRPRLPLRLPTRP